MQEVFHQWGGDLQVSANGDLLVADPVTTGEQRVLRRLMTNPQLLDDNGLVQATGDYIFEPTYGAGLPRKVGLTIDVSGTQGEITDQLLQEKAVSNIPSPIVSVTPFLSGLNAQIQYNDAQTNQPVALDFNVTQ